jgi:hypothetical protein
MSQLVLPPLVHYLFFSLGLNTAVKLGRHYRFIISIILLGAGHGKISNGNN